MRDALAGPIKEFDECNFSARRIEDARGDIPAQEADNFDIDEFRCGMLVERGELFSNPFGVWTFGDDFVQAGGVDDDHGRT
jgi:hypothetical protein